MSEAIPSTLAQLWGGGPLPPFKPTFMYIKELDWLLYLARDCSYIATPSKEPHIELLKDGSETIGFKILGLSRLPVHVLDKTLTQIQIVLNDLKGVTARP